MPVSATITPRCCGSCPIPWLRSWTISRRQKLLDRVVLMTFSEFGRTVAENGRRGTDHGAAAPMFLAGGKLRGGLIGGHPSLTDLDNGGFASTPTSAACMPRSWTGGWASQANRSSAGSTKRCRSSSDNCKTPPLGRAPCIHGRQRSGGLITKRRRLAHPISPFFSVFFRRPSRGEHHVRMVDGGKTEKTANRRWKPAVVANPSLLWGKPSGGGVAFTV